MTTLARDQDVDFLLADAKGEEMMELEALRHHWMQKLLNALQRCEAGNALHADAGHGAGQIAIEHADQIQAQELCAAVRKIEEIDALLEQAAQRNRRTHTVS